MRASLTILHRTIDCTQLYKTVHSCSCTHHNFVAVMYTGTEQGPLAAHNVTLYQLYTFSPNRRRRRRPACVPRRPSRARPPTRRPTRRPGRRPAGGRGVRKGNTMALYEFSLYNASDYNDPTRRSGRRPPRGLGKVSGRPTRRQVGPEDASWPTHSDENAAIKGWSWPNFWANLASFSLAPKRVKELHHIASHTREARRRSSQSSHSTLR